MTGVYSEVAETTDVGIGCDLEGKSRQGRVVLHGAGDLHALVHGIGTSDGVLVDRTGEEGADRIEKRLHALVLEGRATDNGIDRQVECTLAESSEDLILGDGGGILQHLLHDTVVDIGQSLEHRLTPLLSLLEELGGDLLHLVVCSHGLIVPVDGTHADQVDDALEVLLRTDGQLDWHCIGTEHITHRLDSLQEVGAATVHLIDVAETRHAILLSLTPYGLALRLYAGYGVEGLDGTVEDAERALHLSGKVDVSGSVDQVELILLIPIGPEGGGACRGDGDTTLLLLLHPVHRSGTLVHLTDLVDQTGVVEDTLRGGSLTGIDVGHDTDITC